MLFTYLWYDFLRDLNDPPVEDPHVDDPPVDDPPVIVFISPIVLYGRRDMWSSSL